jgi:hypothetical protein
MDRSDSPLFDGLTPDNTAAMSSGGDSGEANSNPD